MPCCKITTSMLSELVYMINYLLTAGVKLTICLYCKTCSKLCVLIKNYFIVSFPNFLMMKKLLFLTLFFLTIYFSSAQTARDVSVETFAEVKAGGGVYIKWIPDNSAVKYYVFKRLAPKTDWLLLDSVN